ncbi:hypothetical protein GMRT_10024 [Giardia muris]|uniref:Uncharacterized protein n=1 Tax=Giardia muris TaxID=5742 RepID=A0A4Z1SX02_GIAMU|nr:hypothetical protein GMRT_10024 [Giardia muris]|eukprot:TNJ28058.1 hypothetical protein GMRT_10024 [Giardia muris]
MLEVRHVQSLLSTHRAFPSLTNSQDWAVPCVRGPSCESFRIVGEIVFGRIIVVQESIDETGMIVSRLYSVSPEAKTSMPLVELHGPALVYSCAYNDHGLLAVTLAHRTSLFARQEGNGICYTSFVILGDRQCIDITKSITNATPGIVLLGDVLMTPTSVHLIPDTVGYVLVLRSQGPIIGDVYNVVVSQPQPHQGQHLRLQGVERLKVPTPGHLVYAQCTVYGDLLIVSVVEQGEGHTHIFTLCRLRSGSQGQKYSVITTLSSPLLPYLPILPHEVHGSLSFQMMRVQYLCLGPMIPIVAAEYLTRGLHDVNASINLVVINLLTGATLQLAERTSLDYRELQLDREQASVQHSVQSVGLLDYLSFASGLAHSCGYRSQKSFFVMQNAIRSTYLQFVDPLVLPLPGLLTWVVPDISINQAKYLVLMPTTTAGFVTILTTSYPMFPTNPEQWFQGTDQASCIDPHTLFPFIADASDPAYWSGNLDVCMSLSRKECLSRNTWSAIHPPSIPLSRSLSRSMRGGENTLQKSLRARSRSSSRLSRSLIPTTMTPLLPRTYSRSKRVEQSSSILDPDSDMRSSCSVCDSASSNSDICLSLIGMFSQVTHFLPISTNTTSYYKLLSTASYYRYESYLELGLQRYFPFACPCAALSTQWESSQDQGTIMMYDRYLARFVGIRLSITAGLRQVISNGHVNYLMTHLCQERVRGETATMVELVPLNVADLVGEERWILRLPLLDMLQTELRTFLRTLSVLQLFHYLSMVGSVCQGYLPTSPLGIVILSQVLDIPSDHLRHTLEAPETSLLDLQETIYNWATTILTDIIETEGDAETKEPMVHMPMVLNAVLSIIPQRRLNLRGSPEFVMLFLPLSCAMPFRQQTYNLRSTLEALEGYCRIRGSIDPRLKTAFQGAQCMCSLTGTVCALAFRGSSLVREYVALNPHRQAILSHPQLIDKQFLGLKDFINFTHYSFSKYFQGQDMHEVPATANVVFPSLVEMKYITMTFKEYILGVRECIENHHQMVTQGLIHIDPKPTDDTLQLYEFLATTHLDQEAWPDAIRTLIKERMEGCRSTITLAGDPQIHHMADCLLTRQYMTRGSFEKPTIGAILSLLQELLALQALGRGSPGGVTYGMKRIYQADVQTRMKILQEYLSRRFASSDRLESEVLRIRNDLLQENPIEESKDMHPRLFDPLPIQECYETIKSKDCHDLLTCLDMGLQRKDPSN